MATKRSRRKAGGTATPAAPRPRTDSAAGRRSAPDRRRQGLLVGAGLLVAVAVIVGGAVMLSGGSSGGSSTGTTTAQTHGTIVQAPGGQYLDITPDTLASKMKAKDFTLLNVKTPYIGEIPGTDMYVPYDQLAARASELPADRTAPIVVYCRTGNESAIAARTLLGLGYTNIENLAGGMTAWMASGRSIVQGNRG
jgi:rhodanese-related sulfurtransferase